MDNIFLQLEWMILGLQALCHKKIDKKVFPSCQRHEWCIATFAQNHISEVQFRNPLHMGYKR